MRASILLAALVSCLLSVAAQGPPDDETYDIKNGKLMRARPEGADPSRGADRYRRSKSGRGSQARPGTDASPLDAELGLTVWTFRRSQEGDEVRPLVAVSRADGLTARESWTPVRTPSDATLRAGQFVRFTVEAPRAGFVYVIARDKGPSGFIGPPVLVFPQRPDDDNSIGPGRVVSAPVWSDARQVYYAFYTAEGETSLDVVFLITPTRLEEAAAAALGAPLTVKAVDLGLPSEQVHQFEALGVSPQTRVTALDNAQVDRLVERWATRSEWLEREPRRPEEALTRRELDASVDTTKGLDRGDPGPQTLIRLAAKATDPWLAVLSLPIVE